MTVPGVTALLAATGLLGTLLVAVSSGFVTGESCSSEKCPNNCGTDGIQDGLKVNLAYNKSATSSSYWNPPWNPTVHNGQACKAVNGRTYNTMDDYNCAHTNHSDIKPWWKVDLGHNYTVHNLTIYRRNSDPQRNEYLQGIAIDVDATLCYKIEKNASLDNVNYLTCARPIRGQVVTLRREDFFTNSTDHLIHYYINFCELQVWGCPDGRYGPQCQNCGRCANNDVCDNYNGTCPNGCVEGYYGAVCSNTCGHCTGGAVCDQTTGHCPGPCAPGYRPDSFCLTECPAGSYGANCTQQCGRCQPGTCNVTNGHCASCAGNFLLPLCTGCKSGYHGLDCTELCGQCANNNTCDPITGHCPSQDCKPGYRPPDCKQECEPGRYGQNCMEACGHCEGSTPCEKVTGHCNTCRGNFSLPLCKVCIDGLFGNNCSRTCGHCAMHVPCSPDNGHCPSGCQPDFGEPLCIEPLVKDEVTQANVGAIVGGVMVTLLLAVIIVIVVIVLRRRQSGKARGSQQSGNGPGDVKYFKGGDGLKDPNAPSKPRPSVYVKPQVKSPSPDPPDATQPAAAKTKARGNEHSAAAIGHRQGTPVGSRRDKTQAGTLERKDEYQASAAVDDDDDDDDDVEGHVYGNAEQNVYVMLKASRTPLDSVQKYLVDRLASSTLKAEFMSIPKAASDKTLETANLPVNYKKNRFAQVLPYDKTRVMLQDGYTIDKASDYINASYISGYDKEKKYIAAQGPRENTAGDFWRMVWQEKITHIVMLTNIMEGGKTKCYQYWEDKQEGTKSFGPVTVTTAKTIARDCFNIRTFALRKQSEAATRKLIQYHFTTWPDHGVPEMTSLVTFWHYVSSRTVGSTAPLLIHCSAGVGRTGTYIGLDIGYAQLINEGSISVPDLVKRLRQERSLMVQAQDQYVFLHEALLEAYTARDTLIPADKVDVIFPQPITALSSNERIDREFQKLMQRRLTLLHLPQEIGKVEENMDKNRNQELLPLDSHVVYLAEHVPGRNQYINAVFASTFWNIRGCILTQLPLPTTLVDFWRMVYGNDITSIISLASPNEEQEVKPFCQYWPLDAGSPVTSDPFEIVFDSKTALCENVTSYSLVLKKPVRAVSNSEARAVRLFHFNGWQGEGDARTVSSLLQLVDVAADLSRVVVQCSDGASKSGLFCVLCDITNRLRHDRIIDVYMAVRRLQTCCPRAVTSLAQYRLCYEAAQKQCREVVSAYANTQ